MKDPTRRAISYLYSTAGNSRPFDLDVRLYISVYTTVIVLLSKKSRSS